VILLGLSVQLPIYFLEEEENLVEILQVPNDPVNGEGPGTSDRRFVLSR